LLVSFEARRETNVDLTTRVTAGIGGRTHALLTSGVNASSSPLGSPPHLVKRCGGTDKGSWFKIECHQISSLMFTTCMWVHKLHLCFLRVGYVPEGQELRQVKSCYSNPVIGHTVINVKAIR
jgi:hypothetical protein